jgi:DNA-binding MarR family transcriptional regulator
MSSDPNTVASLLERMEESGWIERRPHEKDRRAYRIRILPSGAAQFETCRTIALKLQSEVLMVLEPDAREEFLSQLDLIAQACRTAADASPRAQR